MQVCSSFPGVLWDNAVSLGQLKLFSLVCVPSLSGDAVHHGKLLASSRTGQELGSQPEMWTKDD